MSRENSNRVRPGQTRRQFLKKTGAATLAVAGAGLLHLPFSARSQPNPAALALVLDPTDALTGTGPVQWAAQQLRDALAALGLPVQTHPSLDAVSPAPTVILVSGGNSLPARQ
ncbi:MAG: twin-arginine translocation signal domain-containing protein, partial [Verrucomicrobiota bacterium]